MKQKFCVKKIEGEYSENKMLLENKDDIKRRPRVLWFMQYAPHYRENLLRALGEHCDLTVSATPCSDHMLIEPADRRGYRYYEGRGLTFFRKVGFWWLPWEYDLIRKNQWDVIFCVEDMHYPLRYLMYLRWLFSRGCRPKWVWWGHFAGRRDWLVLKLIRRFLINSSDGALTYTEEARRMLMDFGCKSEKVVSSNNSDVYAREICLLPVPLIDAQLNVLFVGRYLEEKRVERLIDLADRLPFIYVRLIGPGMAVLRRGLERRKLNNRVEVLGPKTSGDLKADFEWCHILANPGSLGLQVILAAKHGRCIVVDIGSRHGPEVAIAREAGQPFINWGNDSDVDSFFKKAYMGYVPLKDLGLTLAEYVRTNYTIEQSVQKFTSFF